MAGVWWLTLRGRLTPAGSVLFAVGVALVVAGVVLPGLPVIWTALGIVSAVVGTEIGADTHQPVLGQEGVVDDIARSGGRGERL